MVDYIECAGLRVPINWTPAQLEKALSERKIKLANEKEVMAVFGDSLKMVEILLLERAELRVEVTEMKKVKAQLSVETTCPACGYSLQE